MNACRGPHDRSRQRRGRKRDAAHRWRPAARRDDDGGWVSLLVLVLVVAVLAMIGLSVDGGGKVRAQERADNLAAEAARAAGQALQGPQAIQGGPKVIDPQTAVTAAGCATRWKKPKRRSPRAKSPSALWLSTPVK